MLLVTVIFTSHTTYVALSKIMNFLVNQKNGVKQAFLVTDWIPPTSTLSTAKMHLR